MTRLTGLNSGLDVDALVKASMTTYQSKIDTETQNKKVLEYQQEQYKKIISDSANFYDKYFDILKTGNLISTNSYQSVSFKSGDDTKVTAKGFAGADVSDYKVTVTQIASKATSSFDKSTLANAGNNYMTVKVGDKSASVPIVKKDGEVDMAATVKSLNAKLNTVGIDVTSKYSEFSNNIVLESGKMGESVSFQSGVGAINYVSDTPITGMNAKGVITKGKEIYTIDQTSNVLTVDNVQFSLKGVTQSTTGIATVSLLEDAVKGSSKELIKTTETLTKTENGITTKKTIKITSPDGTVTTTTADGTKTTTTVSGLTTTKITTKTVDGITTTTTTTTNKSGTEETITEITKDGKTTIGKDEDKLDHLKELEDGAYTITENKTEIVTNGTRTTQILTTSVDGTTTDKTKITTDGTITTITKDGIITSTDSTTGAVSVKKDDKITNYTSVSLSGSTDVTALKDKIVSFVNDYNTLLSSINTKIYETRDKDYMPLSDEQKKEMTDDQIEKWETKAQTGLIRKDMDLERITSAMKSTMSTVISGSGLTLESIGIKPVANYAEKNGMFTIDESTLTKALEENAGNIKDLFTRAAYENDKGGIFTQLAATLKSEFKLSTSSLSKKAGIDGTSTQYSNTLTKSIAKKKTLIEELNDKFSVKETSLYKKYSALETALEKLNSQQASLSSMLGTS